MQTPTEFDARRLVEATLGCAAVSAHRFVTGLCHYVYEVTLSDGRRVVARLSTPDTRDLLEGGVYWHGRLAPLGVPLPALLHADTDAPLPFVILERLPGDDLHAIYAALGREEKHAIAAAVVGAQQRTARLPEAGGFGHAQSYDDPALRRRQTWLKLIEDMLARSRQRIVAAGVTDPAAVARVERFLPRFTAHFSRVRPVAFLDDTTTKNVLVHEGRFSGIVDVDEVCFGDPLLTPALTRMALLARQRDTDYVDHWLDLIGASAEARAVVEFYTAVFCADFLAEQGHAFNRTDTKHDPSHTAFLETTLRDLLGKIEGWS
jgi:aminoglycoside phosphotransferase